MENCKNKEAVCQCVDWSCEDAGTVVEHLLKNYEFDHLDLDYSSLDHGAKLRLCQIGPGQFNAGGPFVTGTEVYARELVSDTLSAIYDAAKVGGVGIGRIVEKTLMRSFLGCSMVVINRWPDCGWIYCRLWQRDSIQTRRPSYAEKGQFL